MAEIDTLTERQAIDRLREAVQQTATILSKMTDALETLSERLNLLAGRMDAAERRIKGV